MKIPYQAPPHVVEFLTDAHSNTRLSRDANKAKYQAMNQYGIGTEIRRATLACPFVVPTVPLDAGRKPLPSGVASQMPSRKGPGQTSVLSKPRAARKPGMSTQSGDQ